MAPVNEEERAICDKRGHEPSGRGITEGMGPTWSYCRFCNVRFRWTEPTMVEHPDDRALTEDPTRPQSKVVDLMAALQASLEKAKAVSEDPTP